MAIKKAKFNPIQKVESDELPVMRVGNWAEKKYKLVGKYCDIFSTGMRYKWNLIYLDLFSGPGFVLNRDSKHLIKNSALIAMSVPTSFDHYILNDYDLNAANALRSRIERIHPETSYKVYNEDANSCIDLILSERPKFNNGKPTLTFCFLDPFSVDLDFQTIEKLAKRKVDILMLHALYMDAKRNLVYYIEDKNNRIASYTNNSNWREEFKQSGLAKSQLSKKLKWSHNIWMGVSVENQKVEHRIELLKKTDARVKFLSLEPLIGPLPDLSLENIDWVIVGGESGFNPRPMETDWVLDIQEQCEKTDTAFFFKQWGGFNKKKNGRTLNGRTYDEMPEIELIQHA